MKTAKDRAGTHLIDVLGGAAELHSREVLDGDLAIGEAFDLFLEDLHRAGGGVLFGEVPGDAQNGLSGGWS